MLLTITATGETASGLGFLLHKHPGRHQVFEVSVGQAHVFYPEDAEQRTTVALLLEVDPIALVRGRQPGGKDSFALAEYVNDRPYAASSLLAGAISKVFRTALSGRCPARPELVDQPLDLQIRVPALSCSGSLALVERVFAPLGWAVQAEPIPLDPLIPDWGASPHVDLRLTGAMRLADALNQLYVLLPVLDGSKHYWIAPTEVDKLIRAGEGWLATHPDRELITARYLGRRRALVASAMARLTEIDDLEPDTLDDAIPAETEEPERTVPLAELRKGVVMDVLRSAGARRVADVGCGEGALLRLLLADHGFTEVLGVDVSHRALQVAARRLRLDQLSERQRQRITLIQSSLTYRDERLAGFDAIVLMEVIEHVDPPRLPALGQSVFGRARPATVIVTTPNVEYNVRYETMAAGARRHRDHRFEWTRPQFRDWAESTATTYGYNVRYLPVGDDDPDVGPPTQLAVFARTS